MGTLNSRFVRAVQGLTFRRSLCWKGKSCQHRVHVSASQIVYLQEITLKGIVFGRGQTMWVSPDSCVSKVRTHVSAAQPVYLSESTLKRRYLVKAGLCRFRPIPVWQRLLWRGKDVLKPDWCQYRPIRECQGRLFRKETCLETKIMLKTGPF